MKDIDIFMTDLFPYLEGEELKGSTLTLTIKDIRQEKMQSQKGKEESKYVLYFKENSKGFVLNKTNAKRLAVLYGKMTGSWADKKITLYTEEVKAFGETHNALRVAEAAPTNGNGEMNLDKLLVLLNKVERIQGFYEFPDDIKTRRSKVSDLPFPDDTDGWRNLFSDARDFALAQINEAVELGNISPDQLPIAHPLAQAAEDGKISPMSDEEHYDAGVEFDADQAPSPAAADDLENEFPEIYADQEE